MLYAGDSSALIKVSFHLRGVSVYMSVTVPVVAKQTGCPLVGFEKTETCPRALGSKTPLFCRLEEGAASERGEIFMIKHFMWFVSLM